MFEGITENLTKALSFFRRSGKLTEANIKDGMRQVRQALLEADVNYEVATNFIKNVTEQAVGDRVLKSLNPSEQIVGIVYQELVNLMGPVDHSLHLKRDGITILMMCGLQGSGKTTTCGKLARMLKQEGWNPMLVAADLQRPAAIEQLKVIGEQIGVPVYSEPPDKSSPVKVCRNGLAAAKKAGDIKVLILDTAGRLHVDDELMNELELIDRKLGPDQALLVCDAMTGQDAVNSAKAFNDALELDGVILTKLDGDTRGGAALSIKAVADVPIKYIGVGEQLDRLETFHPDRMASRILGGGDMATLIEKAQREFDAAEMEEQQRKMMEGKFTLNDFRKQMDQVGKLGSMRSVMKLIPGMGAMADANPDANPEEDMKRLKGIIDAMTPAERLNPDVIDHSRRNRIARGSGSEPADVNNLLKQFRGMADMMAKMASMGLRDRMRMIKEMSEGGMMDPNAQIHREKQRSKRGPLDAAAAKQRKKQQRKKAKQARKKNRKR
ncbi:MAG: signal recognition particle protein [Planctomycetaceae bacterium]